MKAKRMKKMLMAAGAERNLANKIAEACHGQMSHEDMYIGVTCIPGLAKVFAEAVRQGVAVKAEFANLQNGEVFQVKK